jgi:hypothetical protein
VTTRTARVSDTRGILAAAVSLLLTALGWAAVRGEEAPLAWLLAGAGSITLGVWLGVAVTRPPGLMTREPPP